MSRAVSSWVMGALIWALPSADPLPQLLVRFGELYSEGRLVEAREAARAVVSELETSRPPLDLDRAAGLNNLAAITAALGEWGAAEPLFQEALEVGERVAGPEDPARAILMYNLAGLHVVRGRDARAEELYRRSLAIWEKIHGTAEPAAAETLNNLGFLHLRRRSYQEAERLFQRALSIWEQEGESPEHAVTLSNLALLKAELRENEEAEVLYRRALAMEEKALGEDHPEIATTLNALGLLLAKKGKSEEAVRHHRRALSILDGTLDADDPLTQETLELLETGDAEVSFQLILVRAKSEAESLRNRAQRGEDVGELARQHSLDSSAEAGGYVSLRPSELRPELRRELALLDRDEVSAPFQLGQAWAVVKKGR